MRTSRPILPPDDQPEVKSQKHLGRTGAQFVRFLSRSKKVLMTRYRRCKWFEWFDIELGSQARIILMLDIRAGGLKSELATNRE